MNLIEFISEFPDEESCMARWKEYREKIGLVCPNCKCEEHYWKSDKECFECKKCHYRQSLRANTVMHGSQLPFRYWFVAMHLLTSTKKSFSAKELQRQLGHKYYNPIWAMLHKIRLAMGKRDSRYDLEGVMELDEGFFSTEVDQGQKDEPLKRGRGSQKKTKVLVMAESQPVEAPKASYQKPRKVGHIKMYVIDDLKAATEYESTIGGKVILDEENRLSMKGAGGLLAGAAKDILQNVETLMNHKIVSLNDAWAMASTNVRDMLKENLSGFDCNKKDEVRFQIEGDSIVIKEVFKNGKRYEAV